MQRIAGVEVGLVVLDEVEKPPAAQGVADVFDLNLVEEPLQAGDVAEPLPAGLGIECKLVEEHEPHVVTGRPQEPGQLEHPEESGRHRLEIEGRHEHVDRGLAVGIDDHVGQVIDALQRPVERPLIGGVVRRLTCGTGDPSAEATPGVASGRPSGSGPGMAAPAYV